MHLVIGNNNVWLHELTYIWPYASPYLEEFAIDA
jgi:hypothetical protein